MGQSFIYLNLQRRFFVSYTSQYLRDIVVFILDLFIIARLRKLFTCIYYSLSPTLFLGSYSLSLDEKHCSKLLYEFGQLFNTSSRSALKDITTHCCQYEQVLFWPSNKNIIPNIFTL